MFKIAVCDDEKFFREEIKSILKKYLKKKGVVFEIDTFSSGEQFVALGIEMMKYKVVFLDINMDGLDGIMTAKKIRENSKEIFLVFVTAFVNYTIEGYKVDAVRYILKNSHTLDEAVYECMDAIQEKMEYTVTWVGFDFNEGYKNVSMERLLYIESNLHKLEFYIMEDHLEKYTLYNTLDNIDEQLRGNGFLRIHQSFLVNMKYIKKLCRYMVILNNGIELRVPRARYKEVEEAIVSYRGEW